MAAIAADSGTMVRRCGGGRHGGGASRSLSSSIAAAIQNHACAAVGSACQHEGSRTGAPCRRHTHRISLHAVHAQSSLQSSASESSSSLLSGLLEVQQVQSSELLPRQGLQGARQEEKGRSMTIGGQGSALHRQTQQQQQQEQQQQQRRHKQQQQRGGRWPDASGWDSALPSAPVHVEHYGRWLTSSIKWACRLDVLHACIVSPPEAAIVNCVHVAAAFRRLAALHPAGQGIRGGHQAALLRSLLSHLSELSAEHAGVMQPREVAGVLYAAAVMRYPLGQHTMTALMQRLLQLQDRWNPIDVANVSWALSVLVPAMQQQQRQQHQQQHQQQQLQREQSKNREPGPQQELEGILWLEALPTLPKRLCMRVGRHKVRPKLHLGKDPARRVMALRPKPSPSWLQRRHAALKALTLRRQLGQLRGGRETKGKGKVVGGRQSSYRGRLRSSTRQGTGSDAADAGLPLHRPWRAGQLRAKAARRMAAATSASSVATPTTAVGSAAGESSSMTFHLAPTSDASAPVSQFLAAGMSATRTSPSTSSSSDPLSMVPDSPMAHHISSPLWWLQPFAAAIAQRASSLPLRSLVVSVSSLSKLAQRNDIGWDAHKVQSVCSVLASQRPQFSPQDTVNALNAFVRLHHRPPEAWMQQLVAQVSVHLPSFKGEEVCLLVYAFARLGFRAPHHLMQRLYRCSVVQLSSCGLGFLSLLLWSACELEALTLPHTPTPATAGAMTPMAAAAPVAAPAVPAAATAAAADATATAAGAEPAAAATATAVASALASETTAAAASCAPRPAAASSKPCTVSRPTLPASVSPPSPKSKPRSYASTAAQTPPASQARLPSSPSQLPSSHNGATFVPCVPPPGWTQLVVEECCERVWELGPHAFTLLMFSLACAGHAPTADLEEVLMSRLELMVTHGALSGRQLSVCAWAIARLQLRLQMQLQIAFVRRCREQWRRGGFTTRAFATMLWGVVSSMRRALGQQWVDEAASVALRILPSCGPNDLPQLLRSFARLGLRPGRAWVCAGLGRAQQLVSAMGVHGLSAVLWACWWLRCAPGTRLLQMFAARLVRERHLLSPEELKGLRRLLAAFARLHVAHEERLRGLRREDQGHRLDGGNSAVAVVSPGAAAPPAASLPAAPAAAKLGRSLRSSNVKPGGPSCRGPKVGGSSEALYSKQDSHQDMQELRNRGREAHRVLRMAALLVPPQVSR